ncbi:MAG: cytidine deaminase [Salinibacter sp.]
MPPPPPLAPLRERAKGLRSRAHVPFSEAPTAAVLLLDDGRWIPGVRVESASYSLTLPAVLNAYTTAVAAGVADAVAAFVLSRPFRREEALYVEELPQGPYEAVADDAWLQGGWAGDGALPPMGDPLAPTLARSLDDPAAGIDVARRVARQAYVPSSDYAVGAVLDLGDGRLVPGANVEHPDWARILCAERNALGTVQSYDLPAPPHLFLACAEDAGGTPCGACRQLLAELAPDTTLWMDRHAEPPERTTVSALLPGSFRGQALLDEA